MSNRSSDEVRADLADAEAGQLRDADGQIILPEHDEHDESETAEANDEATPTD